MRGALTGGEGEATCSEAAEGAGELCMAAIGGGDGCVLGCSYGPRSSGLWLFARGEMGDERADSRRKEAHLTLPDLSAESTRWGMLWGSSSGCGG